MSFSDERETLKASRTTTWNTSYQLVLCLVSKLMGQFVQVEVRSVSGGVAAVVKTSKRIYVFAFNLHGTAEEALQQMNNKEFPIPYKADGREVVMVGVEFSAAGRNVGRWLRAGSI